MSNKAVIFYIYRKQVPNYSVIYSDPWSPGSEFSKVTRLLAECGILIQFLARYENFSILQRIQTRYVAHRASYPRGNGHSHSGSEWLRLQDDHSPQSTRSLRMFGAITSSPLHASLVWTVITLPFDPVVVSRLNTAVVKPNNNKYYGIFSASNTIMHRFHGVSRCLQTTQAWHF
jgi:hypothetical protein